MLVGTLSNPPFKFEANAGIGSHLTMTCEYKVDIRDLCVGCKESTVLKICCNLRGKQIGGRGESGSVLCYHLIVLCLDPGRVGATLFVQQKHPYKISLKMLLCEEV